MPKINRPITPTDLANQLNTSFASAEPHRICQAIGQALGGFNISDVARETGLARQSIHRAFKADSQLPNFTTVLAVLTAMGLELKVAPRRGHRRAGSAQAE